MWSSFQDLYSPGSGGAVAQKRCLDVCHEMVPFLVRERVFGWKKKIFCVGKFFLPGVAKVSVCTSPVLHDQLEALLRIWTGEPPEERKPCSELELRRLHRPLSIFEALCAPSSCPYLPSLSRSSSSPLPSRADLQLNWAAGELHHISLCLPSTSLLNNPPRVHKPPMAHLCRSTCCKSHKMELKWHWLSVSHKMELKWHMFSVTLLMVSLLWVVAGFGSPVKLQQGAAIPYSGKWGSLWLFLGY